MILPRVIRRFGLAVLAAAMVPAAVASTQERPIALVGARILPVSAPPIPSGTVIISGGKIAAIGANVSVPSGALRIPAAGKVVIPGLIDSSSALFLSAAELAAAGAADRDVLDAFDPFDQDALDAVRRGVTTVYLSPGSRGSIGGLGAVVKLAGDPERSPLLAQAALKLNLGVTTGDRTSSLDRLAAYEAIRAAFRAAEQYARSYERYERDLKAFESQPRATSAGERRPPAGEAAGRGSPFPQSAGPQRPTRPRRVPAQEVLLKALRREIPVRVEAHRADDILNALRLGDEFKLKLILEKAEEAPAAAGEIARRGIPIVWGPTLLEDPNALDSVKQTPSGAAKLSRAGIRVSLTPGSQSSRNSRFVLENAAAAAGYGLSREAALRSITLDAARILGVADRVGSLARGKDADLVVLSGSPWDSATIVEQVFVNGVKVHGR